MIACDAFSRWMMDKTIKYFLCVLLIWLVIVGLKTNLIKGKLKLDCEFKGDIAKDEFVYYHVKTTRNIWNN